jgi:hypothetical protein
VTVGGGERFLLVVAFLRRGEGEEDVLGRFAFAGGYSGESVRLGGGEWLELRAFCRPDTVGLTRGGDSSDGGVVDLLCDWGDFMGTFLVELLCADIGVDCREGWRFVFCVDRIAAAGRGGETDLGGSDRVDEV